jgi:hypothetical protein
MNDTSFQRGRKSNTFQNLNQKSNQVISLIFKETRENLASNHTLNLFSAICQITFAPVLSDKLVFGHVAELVDVLL